MPGEGVVGAGVTVNKTHNSNLGIHHFSWSTSEGSDRANKEETTKRMLNPYQRKSGISTKKIK